MVKADAPYMLRHPTAITTTFNHLPDPAQCKKHLSAVQWVPANASQPQHPERDGVKNSEGYNGSAPYRPIL